MDPITLGIILPAIIGGGYLASRAIGGMTKAQFLELIGPRTTYLEGKVAQVEAGMTANVSRVAGEHADQARARVVSPLVGDMHLARTRLTEVTSKFQSFRSSFTPAELTRANAAMERARTILTREESVVARWRNHQASRFDRINFSVMERTQRAVNTAGVRASQRATQLTDATLKFLDPSTGGRGGGSEQEDPEPEPAPPEDDGLNTTLLIVGAASVLILGGGLAFGLMSRKRSVASRGVKNPGDQLRRKLRAHRRALCSMR